MIKISRVLELEILCDASNKFGHYSEQGAVIGDCEFILVYKDDNVYLAHISEFEQDGLFIRLKEKNV